MIKTVIYLILCAFMLLGAWRTISAQIIDQSFDFEIQNEDDILQLEADGRITEETALVLLEMFENPIDLNRADVSDLIIIPGISREEAQAILDVRENLEHCSRSIQPYRDVV